MADIAADNLAFFFEVDPTNISLLINLWLSSYAEILLLNTDWAYKSEQNVQGHVRNVYIYSNWASSLHATVGK